MSQLSKSKLEAALLIALDEMTRADIAKKVGVSERQLYRWLEEDEFQEEVERTTRKLAKELVPTAIRRLKHNMTKAKDADANAAIRLALQITGWLDKPEQKDQTAEEYAEEVQKLEEREAIPTPTEDS